MKEKPQKIWQEGFTHSDHEIFSANLKNQDVVIRINRNPKVLVSSTKLIPKLKDLDFPMQEIIAYDFDKTEYPFAWVLLTRTKGKDLRYELPKMTDSEVKTLAKQIVEFQNKLQKLPKPDMFGYIHSGWHNDNEPLIFKSWKDFILNSIYHHKSNNNNILPEKTFKDIDNIYKLFIDDFESIEPLFFYDDWTIKNVIIHNGNLSGLIDVDWLMAGDIMYWVAFIRTTLILDCPNHLRYFDAIINELNPTIKELKRLDFYTILSILYYIFTNKHSNDRLRLVNIAQDTIDKFGIVEK